MSTNQTTDRESAAFPSINATDVAQAINNVYLVLQSWQGTDWANAEAAKCNVSSFTDIVRALQFQGRKFASAVDLSVKTSQDGIIIAMDSLIFISAIEHGRNEENALLFFQGLLEIAKNSFGKARKCEREFLEIYFSIIAISSSVPKTVQAVDERKARVEKDARRRALAAEQYRVGKEALKEVRMAEGLFSWASPAGLGLQIALPILQVIAHGAEYSNRKKFGERKRELIALFDAIERLQTLDKDLFNVYCCLKTLVMWWSNIKTQLEQIKDNLKHHGVSFYRDDDIRNSVRNSWVHIKREYLGYRDEVSMVQDRYCDVEPFEGIDVGLKGGLLTFQSNIRDFYLRLTDLKDIVGTIAEDHKKLQHVLPSIEAGFIFRLKAIDCCFGELLHCIKVVDPIQRRTEISLVISNFFRTLLTPDGDYAWSCAQELRNIRNFITSHYSGAKAIFSSVKMRFKNPSLIAQASQVTSEMEEKNKEISNFCVDLFANDLWHVDENLEECLLETRQKCAWFRVKLEHAASEDGSREKESRAGPMLHN